MAAPEMSPSSPQPAPPLLNQDGSLNEQTLAETYGLYPDEAMQSVKFGAYSGTIAEMLNDGRCPVGGMIAKAYQEGGKNRDWESGRAAVAQKFAGLSLLDPEFSVELKPQRTEEGPQKKNSPNQIFPPVQNQ